MLSNNSSRATSTFGDFRSGRSNAVAASCGPFPLSFPQERIWFWEQLAPASSLYNVPVALRMRGPLNFQALTKSLNSIVARHEVLRSVLRLEEGQPAQFIRPGLPLVLEVVDISGTPASERELEMSRLVNEEVRRPFNLSRDLLLRARAIRLGEADHALVLTMHHIASDGWSLGILLRELSAAYTAYTRGALPGFPELPLQSRILPFRSEREIGKSIATGCSPSGSGRFAQTSTRSTSRQTSEGPPYKRSAARANES